MITRRGFIGGIIAACAAPAIIRTPGLIMPVKPLVVGDGMALQAWPHPINITLPEHMNSYTAVVNAGSEGLYVVNAGGYWVKPNRSVVFAGYHNRWVAIKFLDGMLVSA